MAAKILALYTSGLEQAPTIMNDYITAILAIMCFTAHVYTIEFDDSRSVDERLSAAMDKLQPNAGSHFKFIKKLVTNRDQIFLTVVPIPDLTIMLHLLSKKQICKTSGHL